MPSSIKTKPKRRTRDLGPTLGEQRDAAGRFAKGHRVSVNNRGQAERGRIRRALAAIVSDEDLAAVIRRAVTDAMRGDRHARQWLSDRLAGTPRRESLEAHSVQLGQLDTLGGVRAAAAVVARAAAAGTLPIDSARALTQQLQSLAELHVAADLAARVADVEHRLGVSRP